MFRHLPVQWGTGLPAVVTGIGQARWPGARAPGCSVELRGELAAQGDGTGSSRGTVQKSESTLPSQICNEYIIE